MNTIFRSTIVAMLLGSSVSVAVEPMSEDALSDFALESGQSFIQVYGPTSAGLNIDVDQKATTPNKDEPDSTTIDSAKFSLKVIEEQLTEQFNNTNNDTIDPNLSAIAGTNEVIVGQAASFDTTSEIQYRKKDFHHDAVFNEDGSVGHSRDLKIDLLKFENIGGDDLDNKSIIGDIYISDWSSRGSTVTMVNE